VADPAVRVAGVEIDGAVAVGGGDICSAVRGTLDGAAAFAKTLADAPAEFFAAEARGRQLLDVDGGPPLPRVLAVGDDGLVLEWVDPGRAGVAAAQEFGGALARMHHASPGAFGAETDGFIGSLPLDNTAAPDWPTFYAERRLAPYLPSLPADVRRPVELLCQVLHEVAGPPEAPARIHGDLWSGNVLWAADGRAWLVDTASAHGGHRETDLAMLMLFGAPCLEEILGAYDDEWPLAAGWRERVQLHQLHPLLVHAVMFGGSYLSRAAHVAERLLQRA
jgi:fructosamine-3-kinase